MADLSGKTIAILVNNYFEQVEFTDPIKAFKKAGARVIVIGAEQKKLIGMHGDTDKADSFTADQLLDDVHMDEFDALVMPGGTVNADQLRTSTEVHIWIRNFLEAGKVVAAICHAPWALVSAGVVKGRHLTSFPSLQDDIQNAGGNWTDEAVVNDNNLITSRNPDDIPAFSKQIISALA